MNNAVYIGSKNVKSNIVINVTIIALSNSVPKNILQINDKIESKIESKILLKQLLVGMILIVVELWDHCIVLFVNNQFMAR